MLGDKPFLAGLTFRLADSAERQQVLELRRQVYTADLGNDGMDEFDEHAHHLIATNEQDHVIAAFRMVDPTQRPFELESFVDLSRFVATGKRPAVLDRFCIRPDHRNVTSRQFIPLGMLKLAINFAPRERISDFVILALPHLRSLYRTALFRPCGLTFPHPMWGDVHLMHLDLIALTEKASGSEQPMSRFLFRTDLQNFRV